MKQTVARRLGRRRLDTHASRSLGTVSGTFLTRREKQEEMLREGSMYILLRFCRFLMNFLITDRRI